MRPFLKHFFYRLGLVEVGRKHLFLSGHPPDPVELQKLQELERHLGFCEAARRIGDWKSALREADTAIAAGADSSLLVNSSHYIFILHSEWKFNVVNFLIYVAVCCVEGRSSPQPSSA